MNKHETGKILSVISEVYPSFRKDRNIQATQDIWLTIFEHTPYELVSRALMAYIATDTKGFPPVPGAINEQIAKFAELDGMTENEAWALVHRALCRGIYNSAEEFEKLPEDIRRIVGDPGQLHQWALLDVHEVNTVIASNFKRSWRVRRDLQRTLACAPVPLIADGQGEG